MQARAQFVTAELLLVGVAILEMTGNVSGYARSYLIELTRRCRDLTDRLRETRILGYGRLEYPPPLLDNQLAHADINVSN